MGKGKAKDMVAPATEYKGLRVVAEKVVDVEPAAYNPRTLTETEKYDLKKSLQRFGFLQPVVVNVRSEEKGWEAGSRKTIVGGHQRVEIWSKEMGNEEIPAVHVDLDEDQERELNLRLNKNLGEWDVDLLADFHVGLLRDVGFEDKELKKIFARNVGYADGMAGEVGEEVFTSELLEENNYVLFLFDNVMDWNVVKEAFDLRAVHGLQSREGYRKKGVGRVVNGRTLIDLIEKAKGVANDGDHSPKL